MKLTERLIVTYLVNKFLTDILQSNLRYILSQTNPAHVLTLCLLKIHFKIIPLAMSISQFLSSLQNFQLVNMGTINGISQSSGGEFWSS
jgi:hypothetical protein